MRAFDGISISTTLPATFVALSPLIAAAAAALSSPDFRGALIGGTEHALEGTIGTRP